METSRKLVESGREPLPQLADRPEIDDALLSYWTAFADLSTERQLGMGIGPIPRSKIREYGRSELWLDDDLLEYFYGVITAMDADFVQRANAVKKPEDERMRSFVSPDDTAGVARILNRVAKPPEKPRKQRPKPNG